MDIDPIAGPPANLPPETIAPVERPWWAVSNVANKVWIGMVAVSAATLTAAAIVAISNPAGASVVATVAGVSLAILLGIGLFELARRSDILPKPLQYMADLIHAFAVETLSFVGASLLYFTPLFSTNNPPPPLPGQRPILFVHGYLHNSSGGDYIKARFKHANMGPVYTINLGNPITFKSIEEYSRMVQAKVDEIVKETGCTKVVVIGHSMGGIAGAEAATKLDEEHHIDQLITLGSPLHGTRLAYLGLGECAKEMRYSSDNPFIENLVERIDQYVGQSKGKVHCFSSQADGIVQPVSSAYVKGAENTVFSDHGHLSFLFSDRAIDGMISIIRQGEGQV